MRIARLKLIKLLVPLCLLSTVSLAYADELNEVSTDSGIFRGHASEYAAGVTVFKGIAYASPPVRDLRWKPPVAAIHHHKNLSGRSRIKLRCDGSRKWHR